MGSGRRVKRMRGGNVPKIKVVKWPQAEPEYNDLIHSTCIILTGTFSVLFLLGPI